ncbi:hypothetical protein [Pseudomonas fluorescens]|uniref:hypothetical protein n=1 Tax=Pseudomonas fluorescens TaxID=294 RepID=UPI0007D0670F|nr:hypothetical protein [Pseudomonas fluorescens]
MDKWCLFAAAERTCTSFASKIALTFNTQEDANGVINNFGHEVTQNAMDLAVLDWCHLYGQRKDAVNRGQTTIFSRFVSPHPQARARSNDA